MQAMVGESGRVKVVVGALLGTHGAHARHTTNVHTLQKFAAEQTLQPDVQLVGFFWNGDHVTCDHAGRCAHYIAEQDNASTGASRHPDHAVGCQSKSCTRGSTGNERYMVGWSNSSHALWPSTYTRRREVQSCECIDQILTSYREKTAPDRLTWVAQLISDHVSAQGCLNSV